MKLACLLPTYGRPRLVRNALACFLAQDYPRADRRLFILDDAGQIDIQQGDGWEVFCSHKKYHTLTAKYNDLARRAIDWGADGLVVWEDDDVYLPWHLRAHAEILAWAQWSHPRTAYSLYTGRLEIESAVGRFHAALAMRTEAALAVGLWTDTHRLDFDQQLLGRLAKLSPPGRPDANRPPSYVYRWGSTGTHHGSAWTQHAEDSGVWYDRFPLAEPGRVEILTPKMDDETARVIGQFR